MANRTDAGGKPDYEKEAEYLLALLNGDRISDFCSDPMANYFAHPKAVLFAQRTLRLRNHWCEFISNFMAKGYELASTSDSTAKSR
eukprot:scaffold22937_cov73-Cyclotella_meneghiniana.AAC.1